MLITVGGEGVHSGAGTAASCHTYTVRCRRYDSHVSDPNQPMSRAEREAQRALLEEAIMDLANAPDPERAAREVMRALDSYMESGGTGVAQREAPVTDFLVRERDQLNWAKWLVVGGAVVATITVAVAFSGGWPVALAVIGIWVLALFALLST